MDLFKDVEEIRSDEPENKNFHYYYNREERLAKAPANVREYYKGGMRPVKGVKVLFTKQNRWIFLSLVFFVAVVFIYNGFNHSRNYACINSLDCELQSFSFQEEVYVNLKVKRNVKSEDKTPKNIEVQFFMIDPNNQVSDKKTEILCYDDSAYAGTSSNQNDKGGKTGNSDKKSKDQNQQSINVKFTDFDILRVDAIVNVDGVEKELSAKVKR